MVVEVASLARRSPDALRAFVRAQRVVVNRFPDSVEPTSASLRLVSFGQFIPVYWRFLLRRVPLEGICALYKSYDASGAENDWNLNIVPGPGYEWMLDPGILFALSSASGAPHPVDPSDIKSYDGAQAIEAEVSPDNGLHGKFEDAGLPIESGSWWPEQSENEGLGPTGRPVGVYGAFVGDYGHGGRPEIHPFDAFWRRFDDVRADTMSWDLGVFQDDSNRFNANWSKPPIDVEFRVPFCVDFPVTIRSSTRRRVVFTLTRSNLCSVVAKNTLTGLGPAALTETFTGRTVVLNRTAENILDLRVEDLTGVGGPAFTKSLADLRFTRTRRFGLFTTRAWLSGSLVIRVAAGQDGFAYWNLAGPNSPTAADAADDRSVIVATDQTAVLAAADPPPPTGRPIPVRVVDAKAVVDRSEQPELAGELLVEAGERPPRQFTLQVRPREEPLLYPDPEEPNVFIELESFDLSASVDIAVPDRSVAVPSQPTVTRVDTADAIGRLAGLTRVGRRLRPAPTSIEIDDSVSVQFETRYAPFRDGAVQGEEDSALATALTEAVREPARFECDVRLISLDGDVRRVAGPSVESAAGYGPAFRTETTGNLHRLVVESLGDSPMSVQVRARFRDAFGLVAEAVATATNYRIIDPAAWLAQATGVSLAAVNRCRRQAEASCVDCPDADAITAAGLLSALDDVLAALANSPTATAHQLAGAARLVERVNELVPTARLNR